MTSQMTLAEFVRKALLVPFKEKGRDYNAWDCWGLVRCGERDVFDIQLPEYLDYDSTREYAQLNTLISSAIPFWNEVKDPKPGDVALFTISGTRTHTALIVDAKNALHAERKVGTVIEPIKGIVWGKRLEGIYRHV